MDDESEIQNPEMLAPMQSARKKSGEMLQKADILLDQLDTLTDILAEVEIHWRERETKLFEGKAKEYQDSDAIKRFVKSVDDARSLIDHLKREKWNLSRREMSLDLRVGELEDYRRHVKEDVSTLNGTVDTLGNRLICVENELCELQGDHEELELQASELRKKITKLEARNKALEERNKELQDSNRKNTVNVKFMEAMKKETEALKLQVVLLQEENESLRDIYKKSDEKDSSSESESDNKMSLDSISVQSKVSASSISSDSVF